MSAGGGPAPDGTGGDRRPLGDRGGRLATRRDLPPRDPGAARRGRGRGDRRPRPPRREPATARPRFPVGGTPPLPLAARLRALSALALASRP
ncbi:MAG: hypothetical protein M3088_06445 [Actinomycetota bacterium]|nr:hypothetical protein [Actinomycetota bacterium]